MKTLQRAYEGLTFPTVAFFTGYSALVTVAVHMSWAYPPQKEGWYGKWMLLDFLSLFAVDAVALALLVPTINLASLVRWKRYATFVVMIVVTTLVTTVVRLETMFATVPGYYGRANVNPIYLPRFWLVYCVLCMLIVIAAELYRLESVDREIAHRVRLDRAILERELLAARLQVLRAQIEPHFLFNTLGTVSRLYETQPAAGREMLENLMRYLEVALPKMQSDDASLRDELMLVEAFLEIQKIRMGDRLAFSIEADHATLAHTLPSMMILTLVENAIKHGVAPMRDGGRVRVSASVDAAGKRLVLEVADTGRGFGAGDAQGSGVGIANIRARLAARFGDAASLAFRSVHPHGAAVTLSLPVPGGTVFA